MSKVTEGGFTLVELMIGILVLAALIAAGAPAFTKFIRDNRMLSEVYSMRSALNGARSRALAERTFVTVCSSADQASCGDATVQWNQGLIAFSDIDGDGQVDDPNDAIFIARGASAEGISLTYSSAADPNTPIGRLRFDSRGHAAGFNGTFTLCNDRGNAEARGLVVSPAGNVRAAVTDPNDPGSDTLANCQA